MTITTHASFAGATAAQVRAALACAEQIEASAGAPLSEDDLALALYRHWYVGPVTPEPVEEWWPPLAGMFRAAHAGGTVWADRDAEVVTGGIAGVAVVRSASGPRALCQGDYVSAGGAGLAPRRGSRVRACARHGAMVADGWWRTWGPAWDRRSTPPGLVRVYFAARLAQAPELVARVTGVLVRSAEPWAFKIGVDAATLARADAAVAYLPTGAWDAVAPLLVPACADLLRPAVPPLTSPVAPGIGLADDPGGELSFGESRCRLLARAHRLRGSGADPVAVAARVFADHGLDPSAPHLRSSADR
ncbi:MAG: T3SS effector HopA1 family protein [Propioniciclava sp.]|uniref:T3SS effector HopA1 family protein n=1 Tax=Propioniciclava sp. TaxID=2038686 RepID=UPI0039E322F8